MEIFKNYTTSNVLFDEPFETKSIKLYPIKVKDYRKFEQYLNFFMFSKQHYGIADNYDIPLLDYSISVNIARLQSIRTNKRKTEGELLLETLNALCEAFSILCRELIIYDNAKLNEGVILFRNSDNSIQIDSGTFEFIRPIILKQNAITEPKIFEDDIEARLAEKWANAQAKKNKGSISGLGEMANLISCYTGKTYEQLYNQNLLQLYSDFQRCINTENARATNLFRTVSDKVQVVQFAHGVIGELYKDPYAGMWKDRDAILG